MDKSIYVGLDVHLNSITAAVLDGDVQIPQVIKLSGDLMQTRRLFRRLAQKGPVRSCYEASGRSVRKFERPATYPLTGHVI